MLFRLPSHSVARTGAAYRIRLVLLALLALAPGWAATAAAGPGQATPDRAAAESGLMAGMQAWFADLGSRLPGHAGNLEAERRVAARFQASGFDWGAIRFQAPSFVPGATALLIPEQPPFQLHPLHPSLLRPGNFLEDTLRPRVVYLGKGAAADLAAVQGCDLNGALFVMDFDCGTAWIRLLRFGPCGFVFAGTPDPYCGEARRKVHNTEVSVPRFLLLPAEVERLMNCFGPDRVIADAVVEAEPSRWRNEWLRDLWVLVPGADPDLERDVIVMTAPLDCNGVAPGLAEGGQAGANLYLLLHLLESFRAEPPARSVLLVAVNAHTQAFLGERLLAWHLLAPRHNLEGVRATLAAEARYERLIADYYRELQQDLAGTDRLAPEAKLIALRRLEDRSTGRNVRLKAPIVALAKRDVNLTKAKRLRLQQDEDLSADVRRARMADLAQSLDAYVHVLTLFNKVGVKTTLGELTAAESAILDEYVDTIGRDYGRRQELNQRDLDIDVANGAIRQALSGRPVRLVVNLDLNWRNREIGFCSFSAKWLNPSWSARLGLHAVRVARDCVPGVASPLLDTMTNLGGLSQQYYFPEIESALACFALVDTPAVSLKTAFADPGPGFTPADTIAALDEGIVAELFPFLTVFFRAFLAEPAVTATSELPDVSGHLTYASLVKTYKFDEFAATVLPQLPVPNTAVIFAPARLHQSFVDREVIRPNFLLTDARASQVQYGPELSVHAYQMDADFRRVQHVLDVGDVLDKVPADLLRPQDVHTLALFPCVEYPIWCRQDSSSISFVPITVEEYIVLDAAQNSAPRKYGIAGIASLLSSKVMPFNTRGPAAVYLAPGRRVKILTDEKMGALNAEAAEPEGRGFASAAELGPDLPRLAAGDMAHLNRHRLRKLRGVSNELIDGFLERGAAAAVEMADAARDRDPLAYLRSLYAAVGSQMKAYRQIAAMTNDMLKAVVFYMALLLPFCFFVQKLLFRFVKLEWQLCVFGFLFLSMFAVFRLIHPAFRVAQAPEAILIAFVMGTLGAFVIFILHSRFEGEMQLLFLTYSGMEEAAVGYSTVGQKAMLIGVNNMKRRRIRTTLTTATVVLVTFTMLAFSSVSRRLSPTVVAVSSKAPYTGLFFQWPGNRRMDEATLDVFRHLFAGQAETILVRRWLLPTVLDVRLAPPPFAVSTARGGRARIDAFLGLSRADASFLGRLPLLPGSEFFSADDAAEAVLPVATAAVLGLTAADVGTADLFFNGHKFRLVGLVDGQRLRALQDLNGQPILPIKDIETSRGMTPVSGEIRRRDVKRDAGPDTGPAAQRTGVFYVETAALVLLPVETARQLGATPFSVSVRFAADADIWPAVDRVMTATDARFFASSLQPFDVGQQGRRRSQAGVYYVGSGYRTSIGGLSRLVIPILIAGTIILNTMLGAVYERKSEISVYNAIGLNPTHIALFFLAEAFVYGILGAVGGYLIGQLLSLALMHSGLVGGINLNFSSLAVVYVILFTITVVLLSTLYPALVATRTAVPSGKHRWSLPKPDGARMELVFPFIYEPALAAAIVAYLNEYFSRFTEASFGELIATPRAAAAGTDAAGRARYTLGYTLALAPYDLGVTQDVEFCAAYDELVQSYRVRLRIDRLSGQDTNWTTTNKPFLERLRQYLIHWRNLSRDRHEHYARESEALFGLPASGTD